MNVSYISVVIYIQEDLCLPLDSMEFPVMVIVGQASQHEPSSSSSSRCQSLSFRRNELLMGHVQKSDQSVVKTYLFCMCLHLNDIPLYLCHSLGQCIYLFSLCLYLNVLLHLNHPVFQCIHLCLQTNTSFCLLYRSMNIFR